MPPTNDFGSFPKKPAKHNMGLPEHKLTDRYLRKTIDALMHSFDEIEYTTEPMPNMVVATAKDGRKFRITIEVV